MAVTVLGDRAERIGLWAGMRRRAENTRAGRSTVAVAAPAHTESSWELSERDAPNARETRAGGTVNSVDVALKEAMATEGAIGVALVDFTSGMTLGTLGSSHTFDLEVAAAGNTDLIRAKIRTMESLGLADTVEDILITLGRQYHLIRLLQSHTGRGLFLYLVLDKPRANLAMARHRLRTIESSLDI
ncbi:hypothetical protein FrEUN1fDRAFT_4421 [Parafrankia sp. EUN1f]|nr:hypothetical protein FrEUN1fDRAFT_4421 [Parafrankia sp. EUN1f]